jgi:hypothetical protein
MEDLVGAYEALRELARIVKSTRQTLVAVIQEKNLCR